MPNMLPRVIRALSWAAASFAALATAVWVAIVANGNYAWSAFAFTMATLPVNLAVLLLAVVPCGELYLREKERRNRTSLLLAGCSFAVVLAEAVSLWVIPMRGE